MKSIFLLCEYDVPTSTVFKLYQNNITIDLLNQNSEIIFSVVGKNSAKSEQILKTLAQINENDKQNSIYDLMAFGLSKGIADDLYKNNITIDNINESLKEKYSNSTYNKIITAYKNFAIKSGLNYQLDVNKLYFIIHKNFENKCFKIYDLQKIIESENYSTDNLIDFLNELVDSGKVIRYYDEYFIQYSVDILQKYGLSKNIVDYLKELNIEIEDIDDSLKEKHHISDSKFNKIMISYNEMISSGNIYIKINENKLYAYIKNNYANAEFDKNDLIDKMKKEHYMIDCINEILDEMVINRKIKQVNNKFVLRYPKLIDELNKIPQKNNRFDIVAKKLDGQTLEQIGQFYGLTRERIRQIYSREIDKLPVVEEDELAEYIKKYNFTVDVFTDLFKVEKYVFYYLKDKYKVGDTDMSELLDNPDLSDEQLEIIRKKYNIINYNDEDIIANKNSILVAYLKKEDRQVEYSELIENYNKIVQEFDLQLETLTEEDARNVDSILGRSDYVLNTFGRYYRYFDTNDVEEELKAELKDLLNIEPGIYSSELFFKDNSLLMKKIDIRDEYELHNLMRKLFSENDENIVFSRMPDIYINCNDKNGFFESQIQELSPISIDDFADYIYQNYGHKTNSFKAYIVSNFSKYINLNMLISNCPQFTDEQSNIIKGYLTEDIYSINTMKELLTKLFDVNDFKLLNNLNLSKIGYRLRGNYIMKSNISNLEAYLKQQILNEDYFVIKSEFKKIGSTFSSYLYKFIYDKILFKIDEDKYITISKLNKMGISENDIDDFIEEINKILPREKYFNLFTLNTDFKNKILEFDFPECFYETLIMTIPDVKSFTLKNNTIFIITEGVATREKFINSFIDKDKKYVQEIKNEIQINYGIELQEYYIRQFINRKKFYLNVGTDCIYRSKKIFENEINQWDILQYID